jgi:hypothetical protein
MDGGEIPPAQYGDVLCDRLIAIPRYPENHARSRRPGTWMTVRIARRAGKPVEITVLNG